jgi:WD40 repeat protein
MPNQVHSLALSPDGRFALAGMAEGTVFYLDLEKDRLIEDLQGHAWVVSWVAFSPDGRHALSTSLDSTARLWDLHNQGAEVRRFPGEGKQLRAGALSPDGRRLLSGGTSEVLQLWDVTTGQEIKRIEVGRGWINCLAFTPDGRHVVVGDREAGLHDLETGQRVRLFEGHKHEVHSVVLSPDGKRLLTASWDGGVRLWDVSTGRLLRLLGSHDGFAFSAAFSPDGRLAASAGGGRYDGEKYLPGTDHDIRLWYATILRDRRRTPRTER